MSTLKKLCRDPDAKLAVHRAWQRDQKEGSGDTMDFALLVYDETVNLMRERFAESFLRPSRPAAKKAFNRMAKGQKP